MLEDQQKINKFARLNSRLEELKEDIKNKKNEIQTLEDASTDVMMLEDDEELVIRFVYMIITTFLAITDLIYKGSKV